MTVTWKEIAFLEDVATLSNGTPASVGTTASAGTGTAAAREDHVHDLGVGCIDASDLFASGVVDSTAIGTDAVGSEHIKTLTANLDFGGYEATDMVVMQSAEEQTTPVVGKLWQDTDDQKLYICTATS